MKKLRNILLTLLGVGALYIVGSALFLNLALKPIVNSATPDIKVGYTFAYSLFPGTVNLVNLQFQLEDPNIQMHFQMTRTHVEVSIRDLFKKQFHATQVHGQDLRFHLRQKRYKKDLKNIDFSAYPPFPGSKSMEKFPTPPSPPPKDSWTVLLSGVKLKRVQEIWLEEFHFEGMANVHGGFYLYPQTRVRIDPAGVVFEKGSLRIGDRRAIDQLSGAVTCQIDEFDPNKVPEMEIFQYISGSAKIKSRIDSISFINHYLSRARWLRFYDGAGEGEVDMAVEKGQLVPQSFLKVASDKTSVHFWNQRAEGAGSVKWHVTKSRKNHIQLALDRFNIRHEKHSQSRIEGPRFLVDVYSDNLNLFEPYDDLLIRVDLPSSRFTNLQYWNAYLPKASRLQFAEGKGSIKARLESSLKKHASDHGFITLQGRAAHFDYQDLRFGGDIVVNAKLQNSDIQEGKLDLTGTEVSFRKFFAFDEQEQRSIQAGWWGNIRLTQAKLDLEKHPEIQSKIELKSLNGKPLTAFLSEATQANIPGWVINLLAFERLHAAVTIHVGEDSLRIHGLDARGKHTRLRGWLDRGDSTIDGKILVEYGPFAAGLQFRPNGTRLRLEDAIGWFHAPDVLLGE